MNKDLILARFSKNLKSYNDNAKVQKRMAERLTYFISNKNPQKVLEIGCGTGFLTNVLNQSVKFETYKAIDIVDGCSSYIKDINSNIIFECKDIEDFVKNNDEKFDLIISNASLQWVDDFNSIVHNLQEMLNPNGELIFSTFGQENFREIYHAMGTTLKYYSISDLQQMFPNSLIETEIHILAFNSPKDVLKHLQLTGVNAVESVAWTKKDLASFENAYKNLCNKRPTLTYNPIYIKIISPTG